MSTRTESASLPDAVGPAPAVPRKSPPDPLPKSKYSKWRALTLASIYPLMAIHVIHWKMAGKTLAPLELHEVMYTAELGIITAGFLLMFVITLGTAVFGRFFCSWACHMMVLQDASAWILRKLHIRPKPIRSRLLLWVPPLVLVYMFGWPQISRMWAGRDFPVLRTQTDLEGISSWVTTDFWRNLPDPWITVLTFAVCGFLIVYFLGSRAFCTYGCPYGALFLTIDRFAPGRIRVDQSRCAQCGTCTAVCTSDVRVHEEVAKHGTVVNPRCLKDLDCVSACPEDALHYGFGKPSLRALWSSRAMLIAVAALAASILVAVLAPGASTWWGGRFNLLPFGIAVVVLGLVAYGRTGMPARRYHFTLGEELLMGVMFLATLFIYRQLYDAVPFLLTIGLGGAVAYATVLLLRLRTRPNVRALEHALKTNGRLRRAGVIYATATVAFLAFSAHSAYVHYETRAGYQAFAASRAVTADGDAAALRGRALDHLLRAERTGLFRSQRLLGTIAAAYMGQGQWAEAEAVLKRIAARHPNRPDVHLELGRALLQQGRLTEAQAEFQQTLDIGAIAAGQRSLARYQAQANYYLAAIAGRQGQTKEAEKALRQAIALQPDHAQAHLDLGALLLADGRTDEAIGSLRAAIAASPELANAHHNLALALAAQGQGEEAIAEAETAAALAPNDPQTRSLLEHLRAAMAGGAR